MNPALLLVDLQRDFLATPGLEPGADELTRRAAALLEGCRRLSVPVLHAWTAVSPGGEDRMPHWRAAGRWDCVRGTEGQRPPLTLAPRSGELVVEKRWFSPFTSPELDARLAQLDAGELIVCGVHLHGCVRATALDGYQRGLRVWIASDAVGSYDGLHAAVTRRYLEGRAARFASVAALLSMLRDAAAPPPVRARQGLGAAATAAASAGRALRAEPLGSRLELLARAAKGVQAVASELAGEIVAETGKPRHYAEAELKRGAALLRAAAGVREPAVETAEASVRRVPVGTVAQITPFNNPVAIPLGKISAALRWGNASVWKPSPLASGVGRRLLSVLADSGLPNGLVTMVDGGAESAAELMAEPAIDAVSLTGASAAGFSAQAICAQRRIPLQCELGGNNAAIVWRDGGLEDAARLIAEAGMGAAGQRCTANRRVIVDHDCHDELVDLLEAAVAALPVGDPRDPAVRVGPMVTAEARERVGATIERAGRDHEVREAVADRGALRRLREEGPYQAPTLVLCEDPAAEIVQEETFGPVIVVQAAEAFEQALELLNGVRHGLVAALFTADPGRRELFEREARAGVLKIGRATADAGVEAPFGGWKASGVGPPEHGEGNREFHTRLQAIYR